MQHHGSSLPKPAAGAIEMHWHCVACGMDNWVANTHCRNCNKMPSPAQRQQGTEYCPRSGTVVMHPPADGTALMEHQQFQQDLSSDPYGYDRRAVNQASIPCQDSAGGLPGLLPIGAPPSSAPCTRKRSRDQQRAPGSKTIPVSLYPTGANLTRATLAALPPGQQRQVMGNHLYQAIYPLYPDLAVLLTRALLEQSYSELFPLLSSQSKLVSKLLTITSVFLPCTRTTPGIWPGHIWSMRHLLSIR